MFDKRNYRTVEARDGYDEWAPSYEATVLDLMDLRLFERIGSVDWAGAKNVLDLACGTGRIGAWLKKRGVRHLCGLDFSPQMIERARGKGVYDELLIGDVAATGLPGASFDLITESLADEHLAGLESFYGEAHRLVSTGGKLVVVGYHPHFLMLGMPTHFNSASGEPVAVKTYVHLTSDHVAAAASAGFRLVEMLEGVIDEAWLSAKPKWSAYRGHPISFAMVWAAEQ